MIKTRTLLVPIYGSSEIFVTRRAPKEPKGYQETIPDITCSPRCHLAKVTEVSASVPPDIRAASFLRLGETYIYPHMQLFVFVCII